MNLTMQRGYLLGALASCLGLAGVLGIPFHQQGSAAPSSMQGEHEALVYRGKTPCGVDRWSVKTGTDLDAHKVNTHHIVSASIHHMISLPVHLALPGTARIKPVETTVFRIKGYLLETREMSDSDYHTVMAGTSGQTMIVEIPSPACVGSRSPFRAQIKRMRRLFTVRYHPSPTFWTTIDQPVIVTGIGFFDSRHGQPGMAPNAIELHPLLAIKFLTQPSPTPAPLPTPQATAGSG